LENDFNHLGVLGIKISAFGVILREIREPNTHLRTFRNAGAATGVLGTRL